MIRYPAIIILLFIFYLPYSVHSAVADSYDCIRHFGAGTLNWTTGIVTATGTGVPVNGDTYESIHKSALYNAESQIIEILKQIRINNKLTVGEYASANPCIMTGLERIGREAAISKQIYTSAMAVDITLETCIFAAFLQLVLPEEIRQLPLIKPVLRQNNELTENNVTDGLANKKPYTGLIVDARGLGFEPVLEPVIISDNGQEVYSSAFISREYAVQQGVCKYICRLDPDKSDPDKSDPDEKLNYQLNYLGAGDNPLFVKALRREGKSNASLVISMADYEILEKITERHDFFSECRVIIILE